MVTKQKSPAAESEYSAKSVKHLSPRDSVRLKTSMYLGELGQACAFTCLREVTDNVVDEALNGHATECHIHFDDDTSIWVLDDGRGIPVGMSEVEDIITGNKSKMPALQVVTGMLHGGAKLDQEGEAYAVSRGSHGIGIKGTNFTSKMFEVWSFDKKAKQWQYISYKDGRLVTPTKKVAKGPHFPGIKFNEARSKKEMLALTKGTLVHFKSDKAIVGADTFHMNNLRDWAELAAYFTKDFQIIVSGARVPKSGVRVLKHPEGPKGYVDQRILQLEADRLEPTVFVHQSALVDLVFTFTNYDGCDLIAYTNGLVNVDRGEHFDAVLDALMKALAPYRPKKKAKDVPFTSMELREGMVGVVNAKLSAPKFGGQTKQKLVDPRAGAPIREELFKVFAEAFKNNASMVKRIIDRCTEYKNLKNKFTLGKRAAAALTKQASLGLPVNAMVAPRCAPEKRELYVVEGESASGGARVARDASFQEVLPMKGKPLNALRVEASRILASVAVRNVLLMLGYNPKLKDPLSQCRVGRIILLSDPDADGPINGNARLNVRTKDGKWHEVQIKDLQTPEWTTKAYEVIVWDKANQRFRTAPVRNVLSKTFKPGADLYQIKFDNGARYLCSPDHRWVTSSEEVVPRRHVNQAGLPFAEGELQYLPTESLKSGDRIKAIASGKQITQRMAQPAISCGVVKSKLHRSSEEVTLYCLDVPEYHNFVLADGLVSGNCHIDSLDLSLIWKMAPDLILKGMVYVIDCPEYYTLVKGKMLLGRSLDELQDLVNKAGVKKSEFHHIKGWGEFPPNLLKVVAFDPATRFLAQIKAENTSSGIDFVRIMSDEVSVRRELLGL